ncbi:MAG: thioredoxin family protein [Sulfuricurvum sp.]|jgi:thiol-disulfide isomerase/thioredoxin
MRFLVGVLLSVSLLFSLDWPSDYDDALTEAKSEKKEIYLFVSSQYCPYCERFKKEVLSQKEVIDRLKRSYVLLHLSRDFDDIPEHIETKPVPRHYFLDEDGNVIYTTIGARSVEGFYEMLDEVDELKEDR